MDKRTDVLKDASSHKIQWIELKRKSEMIAYTMHWHATISVRVDAHKATLAVAFFLVAETRLYESLCRSVGRSVGWSVSPSHC